MWMDFEPWTATPTDGLCAHGWALCVAPMDGLCVDFAPMDGLCVDGL